MEPLQILIAEVWHRLLQQREIGIDDDFFEIGGDSLLATEMLLELEKITQRPVSLAGIRGELSIRRLALALVSAALAERELVTQIRNGRGIPLFLFHGDFNGLGLYALRLVELLTHDAPVFLVHSNLDKALGVATIEDMARSCLPRLLATWPEGRFRMAGFCHGGLAAWAAAHELEAVGRDVESVILIDSFSVNARPSIRTIARALHVLGNIMPNLVGDRLRETGMAMIWMLSRPVLNRDRSFLRRMVRRFRDSEFKASGASSASTPQLYYFNAMANYVPPKICADVQCLLSDEMIQKMEFAPAPWKPLSRSVRSERLQGDHATCITIHAGDLAAKISGFLATRTRV